MPQPTAPAAVPPAAPSPAATPAIGTPAGPLEVSFSGFYAPAISDADDSDLAFARAAGISDFELGIGAAVPTTPATGTPATPAAATPGATPLVGTAVQPVSGGTPAAPAPATPATPAAETAEQRIARLKKELAEAEGGAPAAAGEAPALPVQTPALPPIGPAPGRPLAAVSGDQNFAFLAEAAKRMKQWAFAHRDGGDMPADLAALLERSEALIMGRQPAEVKEGRYFDAEKTAHLFTLSEEMIAEHLPARQRELAAENHFLGKIRTESATFLDPSKPEGQMFYRVAAAYPALRQYPDWPLLARHIARDYLANQESAPAAAAANAPGGAPAGAAGAAALPGATATPAAAAATVPAVGGGTVPLAPAASIGGATLGGAPVSQARLNEAEQRMNAGTATDEDWQVLSASAV